MSQTKYPCETDSTHPIIFKYFAVLFYRNYFAEFKKEHELKGTFCPVFLFKKKLKKLTVQSSMPSVAGYGFGNDLTLNSETTVTL